LEIAMHAKREEPSRPGWSGDRLDAAFPPEIEAPYFDEILDAWVLSRHADTLAAFRCPGLSPIGPRSKKRSEPPDERSRLKMREETLDALRPAQLQAWRERLMVEIDSFVDGLPGDQPVDIVGMYARPLCLMLAAMVTDIDLSDAKRLDKKAQEVSAAAAEPYDPALNSGAKSANAELRSCFHSRAESLRESGFVALSQTLPCLLGNAWFALLQYPQEWHLLHQQPELIGQATEELLRYAGLARILFRMATDDVDLNGSLIHKDERVILRMLAANRDPERFVNANQVDITRRDAGHLTLGAGPHSCVGASLVRMGVAAITHPLLKRFAGADLTRPVDWSGGSGFRSPGGLWVRLHEV
jgi:hypothetical protein